MNNKWTANPGAYGRWFKKYLDPEIWTEVESTFAGAEIDENWEALFRTIEVFRRLASQIGRHLGYQYPADIDRRVTAYLEKIRDLNED